MKAARNRVGLVFFPAFDWRIDPSHPEREERLLYTRDQIIEEGLLDVPGIEEFRPTIASERDVRRAHVCIPSVSRTTTSSHLIAAGGTMLAADLVLDGAVDRSFALLRPPGHHAMRLVHGSRGFCTINNEAIAVEHIRHRRGPDMRIAIVDTDAHHADGTQDIYYNDPGVLHISLHQDGRTLYPGTGYIDERGGPAAYGQTVNVPLPPGTGDEGMLYVVERLVLPILADWQPDLIINGAGQDNHYTDPLTNMNFTARGYARLTELLSPDIVVLEGGYSIEGALPYVNAGIILALAGLDYSAVREPDWSPERTGQPGDVSAVIAATVDKLLEMWAKRKAVDRREIFGTGEFFERRRRIYYDTSDIMEQQHERIRLCDECSGWRLILSHADNLADGKSQDAAVIIVPWHACEHCRQAGNREYRECDRSGRFDHVYLQDVEMT